MVRQQLSVRSQVCRSLHKERWNEFRPGHPLFTEEDGANLLRWHKNMLAGYRPELQPIPQAKAFPAPPKAAAAAPPSGPADGSTTCEHRCITRKGTNQHIEMETCLDCNKVLKRMPKSLQATASTDAANAAPQASCVTTRSALREAQ